MVDTFVVIAIAIPLSLGIIGLVIAQLYRRGDKKENKIDDRRALEIEVERTAQQKQVTEEAVADKLRESSAKLASEVKTEMRAHVDQLFSNLRQDIDLMHEKIYRKIEVGDMHIAQLRRDFETYTRDEREDKKSIKKTIEMIQTMAWGPDAKSVPPYMLGEEETQEHKDEPDKGAFEKGPSEERDER